MPKTLTLATRAGKLALAQAEIVAALLKKVRPGLQIKINKITTRGDRDRSTALWDLKSGGFFTSRIEQALLKGEADFAVHSFKDLPTSSPSGLSIAAVCDRRFPQDCLIAAAPVTSIDRLPEGAKVGTSSLRRAVQIKRLREDLVPTPIRGNVPTRIEKLRTGEFHAVLLARAGVERLNLADKISISFDPAHFLPAPAQGALAVQTRTDDTAATEIISAIDDATARTLAFAERQILITLQCGCRAPVGAYAEIRAAEISITAFLSDPRGRDFLSRQTTGPFPEANKLAHRLAEDLLQAGGKNILKTLNK